MGEELDEIIQKNKRTEIVNESFESVSVKIKGSEGPVECSILALKRRMDPEHNMAFKNMTGLT